MRVIFVKDLKNQGKKGEIKEVKDGYAKNFLIKNGYAVLETSTSIEILKKEQENNDIILKEEIKKATETKEMLNKIELIFKVKTGIDDKVFGSISSKQIYDEIIKKNINIDKKKIKLKDTIQTLGFHYIEIELHKEVVAKVKIQLVRK